ncbi:MAG: DUF4143 domain-containing protein [Pseudonocardiales bacterium]|nr:DUF4143 domain-containing protein [Pseudonocardiales bacterium]
MLGPLLGVDAAAVLRDPDLLGRVIETFVLAQLRPELTVSEYAPRIYHLRQRDGRHEIDLIVELADGRIIAREGPRDHRRSKLVAEPVPLRLTSLACATAWPAISWWR